MLKKGTLVTIVRAGSEIKVGDAELIFDKPTDSGRRLKLVIRAPLSTPIEFKKQKRQSHQDDRETQSDVKIGCF